MLDVSNESATIVLRFRAFVFSFMPIRHCSFAKKHCKGVHCDYAQVKIVENSQKQFSRCQQGGKAKSDSGVKNYLLFGGHARVFVNKFFHFYLCFAKV